MTRAPDYAPSRALGKVTIMVAFVAPVSRLVSSLLVALALIIANVAVAQTPAYVSESRALELGGGSKGDIVRLHKDGTIEVVVAGHPSTVALGSPAPPRHGTIVVKSGRAFGDMAVVVVEAFASARNPTGSPSYTRILGVSKNKVTTLWHGATGPQGLDREWARHVELTESNLLLYESRPGVRRCSDDKNARLFLRKFDFRPGKRAFRRVSRPPVVSDATVLPTQPTPPSGTEDSARPAFFRPRSASSQLHATDASMLSPPSEIDDGSLQTAWVEGMPGHGIGTFITYRSAGHAEIAALRIVSGHGATRDSYRDFNRVKQLVISAGDRRFTLNVPEARSAPTPLWAVFPEPVPATCVTVEVSQIDKGRAARGRNGDTAISELSFFSALELKAGAELLAELARRVGAGGNSSSSAEHLLAARGDAGADALIAEAVKRADSRDSLLRLRSAMAATRSPRAANQLLSAVADDSMPAEAKAEFLAALASFGDHITPVLAESLTAPSPTVRTTAARLLGLIPEPRAASALISASGSGDRWLRRDIALALSPHRDQLDAVLDAAAAADSPAKEADLWRAAGLIASSLEAVPPAIERTMAKRLAAISDYERRYRLLAALASFPGAEAKAAVSETFSASARRREGASPGVLAEETALLRVASTQLGNNPAPWSSAQLELALADPDPGVRMASLDALSTHSQAAKASTRIIALLSTDRWAIVRRAAAAALRTRCSDRQIASALIHSAESDSTPLVRIEALTSLVSCKGPGVFETLVAAAGSKDNDNDVRGHAIQMLGALGDKRAVPTLVELLAEHRRLAFAQRSSATLAVMSAAALGNLSDPRGTDELLSATRDDAYPEIQAAALSALAHYCPPESRAVFRRFKASTEPQLAIAARKGLSRCR